MPDPSIALAPSRLLQLGATLLLAAAGAAHAEALSPELDISAQAGLVLAADAKHPLPSRPAQGNATQDAVVSAVVAGRRSAAGITGSLAADGSLPQGGVLHDLGDGVGIEARISGRCDGAPAQTDGLYGEYAIDLRNRSPGEAYRITLKIEYANHVAADGVAGAEGGAYAAGLVTLAENGNERFFSNLTSDTALGDRVDVTPTGHSGQPLDDAGTRLLELELEPGAVLHLQGRQELRGAASTVGAGYHGSLAVFLSLLAAVHIQNRASLPTAPANVTQVVENNGGIGNLTLAAVCGALFLAVVWMVLKRRK